MSTPKVSGAKSAATAIENAPQAAEAGPQSNATSGIALDEGPIAPPTAKSGKKSGWMTEVRADAAKRAAGWGIAAGVIAFLGGSVVWATIFGGIAAYNAVRMLIGR